MPGETEQAFFARIRGALAGRPRSTALPADTEVARVVRPDGDVVGLFIERAVQAGMQVHRVADQTAMVARIGELVEARKAAEVLMPVEGIPSRDAVAAELQRRGARLADPDDPDAAFRAEVGVTGVELAVAETASLSLASGGGRRRLASLAVPCHIAVVLVSQIVADLIDWAGHRPDDVPANEVLVSSHSKTADIEMVLVPGIHGPGTLHVVLVG